MKKFTKSSVKLYKKVDKTKKMCLVNLTRDRRIKSCAVKMIRKIQMTRVTKETQLKIMSQ